MLSIVLNAHQVNLMAFDAANNKLITVGLDNHVRITDADSCDFSTSQSVALDNEAGSLAVTAEGYIVVGCDKNQVSI